MTKDDNPYAYNSGTQYQGSASYGGNTTTTTTTTTEPSSAPLSPSPTGQPVSAELISETTMADFGRDVVEASSHIPVLVDFWAPWCGPCKQLTPVIEKAVREAGGAVRLVKMDIEKYPEIAGQLGVKSIPAVIAFIGGQPVDGFMGMQPEEKIKEFIAKMGAASPEAGMQEQIDQILDTGDAALAAGDLEQAAQAFSMVMQHDKGNPRAIAGIVDCMMAAGKLEQAVDLLERLPEDSKKEVAVSGAIKRVEMAQEVAKLGDPVALEARIEADTYDYQARADLSKIYNAQGDRDKAVDMLISIMRLDREWQEDGGRKLLLDLFEAWGPMDPATLSGRRKLSSILFS